MNGLFILLQGSLALAWTWCSCRNLREAARLEAQPELPERGVRYIPCFASLLLPVGFFTFAVLYLLLYGPQEASYQLFAAYITVYLQMAIYFVLLLLLLPLVRRRFSANTCVLLWVIPNSLYYLVFPARNCQLPYFTIPLLRGLLQIVVPVWTVGFTAVLVWKIIAHLLFRRRILRDAVPETDPAALEALAAEIENAFAKDPKLKAVRSPAVHTPLSVGMFRRTTRIVLPERRYTEEEYHLIYRHEIIHISREDAASKFFLVFCTALYWFNPLMWIAARRSAADQELSCDEAVLRKESQGTRLRYAELLLNAAADDRGFTTCLSAKASSMRYRLRAVTETDTRPLGLPVVAVITFLLVLTCGIVSPTIGGETGKEALFPGQDPAQITLLGVYDQSRGRVVTPMEGEDFSGLDTWLSSQPIEEILGAYAVSILRGPESMTLLYRDEDGACFLTIQERYLSLRRGSAPKGYLLKEPADLDYLYSLIPDRPQATLTLGRDLGNVVYRMNPEEYTCVTPGEEGPICRNTEEDYIFYPISEPREPYPDHADLEFSMTPASPILAEIVTEDGTATETEITQREGGTWMVPLPQTPLTLTIRGTFQAEDGLLYAATFQFAVQDSPEEG